MTTTSEESSENNAEQTTKTNTNPPQTPANIPQEIMDIMDFLSHNTKIIFKSQQRDEPELQPADKLKLALDVYQRNPQTFLIRFGSHLNEEHLQNFSRLSIADSDEEMHLMVKDYLSKLKTRQRDVKNRRYAALQQLIKEGEYFSEQEMMKRQPELYQELVGQYLSSKEIKQRDSYDVRNTTFSGILMHNLEQQQLEEIMVKAEKQVKNTCATTSARAVEDDTDDVAEEKSVLDSLEKEDTEIPMNCRQQWGNFDNEQIACSTSKIAVKKSPIKKKRKPEPVVNLITADERELLRQEFISQMHEHFLTGKDEDFDYTNVDDNTQYDDLNLINQDKEDKYFDESDDDEKEDETFKDIKDKNKMEEDDESEDELDVYMSHLSKHHSLQKYN